MYGQAADTALDQAYPGIGYRSDKSVGLGLRSQHIDQILTEQPDLPWFEILADNHIAHGGATPVQLAAVRELYPISFHCVGMSLAGITPLDMDYLKEIRRLDTMFQPMWISDHLCFTQYGKHQVHDLLPFPYTEDTLAHISERILIIQGYLGRNILVENVSTYLQFETSEMEESDFLTELVRTTGCELLLDINNAYVNEINHGINAKEFMEKLPADRVREVHLAGFEDKGEYLIDAHNNRVSNPVWDLYTNYVAKNRDFLTLIEWDNDIPEFGVLLEEANHAQAIHDSTVSNNLRASL